MDLSDALFSPSKARQQQAQAKDWIFVDSWLNKKYYPKAVPAFERNEETLQSLMTLVAFNEKADEEQALLQKVERRALEELQEKSYSPLDAKIHASLQSALPATTLTAIHGQASLALHLDTPTPSPEALATKITTLTTNQFTLLDQLQTTNHLQTLLRHEIDILSSLLKELHSPSFAPPQALPSETSTYTRDAKTLALKLDEYNERLSQYRHAVPPQPGFQDVGSRQADLKGLKERLRLVDEKIRAFEGLPPDVGEARGVLEGLKGELRDLIEKRNEGFEGLVEGGKLPGRRG